MRLFAFLLLLLLLPAACKPKQAPLPPGVDHYTCPMHPSVHSLKPDDHCPICGMDLVPVLKAAETTPGPTPSAAPTAGDDQTAEPKPNAVFQVPVERQRQIGVTYATVERKPMRHTLRAVGMLEPSKALHWEFVARVDGYVEKLFVTSPGELVEPGQPLLSLYSPELRTAELEFVSLLKMRDNAARGVPRETAERLVESSRRRLAQWNLTAAQIQELETGRNAQDHLTLLSPFRGVVEAVPVDQGRNVKVGDHLVDVADISTLWVWAEFYENELSMLAPGQAVTVTSKAYPGEKFEGKVELINPFVDPATRTSRVRIEIANADFRLRPGMYANAELEMEMGEALVAPVSAIMPTGTRNLVFVDRGGGKLEPRFVELGVRYGALYAVKSGLSEGESVVASANFLIDAEAKLQGALQTFDR